MAADQQVRNDWKRAEVEALFLRPLNDLVLEAQLVHRANFVPNSVERAELLSIKTGGCAENCGYCSQSASFKTGVKAEKLASLDEVLAAAKIAKANGSTRFCMGAAWRSPKQRDMGRLTEMVAAVKAEGLETCMTLGMLEPEQASELKEAGLDWYNHNLDTSPEHYASVVTTRTYQDRLDTLENVRQAGINVCCGGILGLGESRDDRVGFILSLANLPEHPGSVPLNALVPIEGTPIGKDTPRIGEIEFVRTVAVARITMPRSVIRLSAGRTEMPDSMQALCFMAGANSIFAGDRLLTTGNVAVSEDERLLGELGIASAPARPIRSAASCASAQKQEMA